MFLQLFSIINGVNVSKPQYLSSDWLHTACQVSFIKKYCNLKISSLFRGYLWISPVNIFEQPHGSDQCGYIHLLYRFVCSFTVVEVWPLCRLGCSLCIDKSTMEWSGCEIRSWHVILQMQKSAICDDLTWNVKSGSAQRRFCIFRILT